MGAGASGTLPDPQATLYKGDVPIYPRGFLHNLPCRRSCAPHGRLNEAEPFPWHAVTLSHHAKGNVKRP